MGLGCSELDDESIMRYSKWNPNFFLVIFIKDLVKRQKRILIQFFGVYHLSLPYLLSTTG